MTPRVLLKSAAVLVACAACVLALVYADLTLRARSAYQEGERFMRWHEHPEEKSAFYAAQLEKEERRLKRELERGMAEAEYRQRLELERFRLREAESESSLKYAYHWYKTAVELFSPPESRWVRLSREKLPRAKELWKRELDARKTPYEDYMLE